MIVRAGDPDLEAVREVVRRIFPSGESVSIERVQDGGSTFVYRLCHGARSHGI